MSRSYT